jgi:hypothetical protein
MQKFCHNCGKQIVTAGAKFCALCGTDLSSLTHAPRPPTPASASATFTPFVAGVDDDDEYVDHINKLDIRIKKLDLEIVKDRAVVETVGTLAQGAPPTEELRRHRQSKDMTKEEVLEQFQKEAGALRPND